ncbi:MAG: zinc dependent phospholipase C family protein [Deltaproteobacteria bacterium]|nr:zinc dependent phospholipase C family protein [Deltaproteobacteria bacterium]
MKDRFNAKIALTAAIGVVSASGEALAYSTKLHMITGHHLAEMARTGNCVITVGGWANRAGINLRPAAGLPAGLGQSTKQITLSPEICGLIKNPATRQYFISGTTGPDTFPGMFGNTDPTHALLWNTAWQVQVLWQNAATPEEKAFVLGWVVHFAGDLNAHGLANLHAGGVWLSEFDLNTVWKHIVTEAFYAKAMLPYPNNFDNRLVWPTAFVKKMFFSPASPLYRHMDYLWNRYANAENSPIGKLALSFGGVYRALFLLWDFHARQTAIWEGRKEHYTPRRANTSSDYIHWVFADQAWNWHKKKFDQVKLVLDVWFDATHRAQQAVVADPKGTFKGDVLYDKIERPSGRVVPRAYKSGGIPGVLDAYKYLGDAFSLLISPQFFTITQENFPLLFDLKRQFEQLGADARHIINAVNEAIDSFTKVLTYPFTLLKDAVAEFLEPVIKEFTDWLQDDLLCNRTGMQEMCGQINAQKAAFKIDSGKNIETYRNWPIYENTIVIGALALDKMKTLSTSSGNETDSPFFGLPSGDFGCTLGCTALYGANANFFMPVAGSDFSDPAISNAMPDYCPLGKDFKTRSRLVGGKPVNGAFHGKTTNQTNNTDAKAAPAFTCFGSVPFDATRPIAACTGDDAYALRADGFVPEVHSVAPLAQLPPVTVPKNIPSVFGMLFRVIDGNWNTRFHGAPVEKTRMVLPYDVFDSGEVKTYIRNGQATTERGKLTPLCYAPLAIGEATRAGAVPDPMRAAMNLKVVGPYDFEELFGPGLKKIATLLTGKFDQLAALVRKQGCRLVPEQVKASWQSLVGSESCAPFRWICELLSVEPPTAAIGCLFEYCDAAYVRPNKEALRKCYEEKCPAFISTVKQVCR